MHAPVLLEEVLRYLNPQPNEDAIDATVDGGGHARSILECIAPRGKLLGIDRDPEMFREAKANLSSFGDRVIVTHGNFADIATIAKDAEVLHPSCILFDLGMSSYHLASERGFSFLKPEEPLDMRYNPASSLTAEAIVNHAPLEELVRIFSEYGEYHHPEAIARAIVRQRKHWKFKSVGDVLSVIPRKKGRIHPATKLFMALRIAVNNELLYVEAGVRGAFQILEPGGRLAVISFHSLEDRIIKRFFQELRGVSLVLTLKPVTASREEIKQNPKARSAKLRVVKKLS
ncbi:MAG: 16S rRNA (cytosine(1402)-N(4))-methyltransferase RsmH [Candidatus Sungbacteria bacterium]|nr:16S rRNA (cytosine(1402)-N(4))-methyltransferase RsmH [Candidatus Sungbacteria bacterium]